MTFTPLHLELLAACHRGHFVHAGYQSLYHDLTSVNLIERNNDGEPLLTRKGIELLKLVAGFADVRALYPIQSESTGFPPIKNPPATAPEYEYATVTGEDGDGVVYAVQTEGGYALFTFPPLHPFTKGMRIRRPKAGPHVKTFTGEWEPVPEAPQGPMLNPPDTAETLGRQITLTEEHLAHIKTCCADMTELAKLQLQAMRDHGSMLAKIVDHTKR